ncbi:response regulator [Gracilibacillus alcaliphilus]|uniref:response regulator n=1 Tax=Gracilibacillus alcaliphilus TaxID=1401441 RepID=UPI00195939C4|nr:response regulator [Gracilibacillus alcaliphilus]MBM7677231.1 two-component system response regulator (stage 0 sporulation protein F) [Gracilibacillus alcaliphilus]
MEKTVLVVDDQVGIRLLLEEVISQESYRVELAVNGKEAFEKITQQQPDLIMLDYKLPIIDGPTLLTMLQKEGYHIPVIMMSGLPEKAKADVQHSSMIHKVIEKPFQLNDIRELVATVLQK